MTRQIVVKGTPGAGKSTVAAELARRLDLAYIELDALHHGPNWSAPPTAEFQARVRAAMAAAPHGWVIDGNYDSKLGETVFAAADTIVWLDLPFAVKLRWLWRRTRHRIGGKVELWNGNRETWRGTFLARDSLFIWMVRAHVRHRREWPPRFRDDPRVVRLRSAAEVRRWLDEQVETIVPPGVAVA
ncbi:MAG: adenylate kinase [Chloroflexota bacterium]|nr:adenylate kinase [Chloroflexota bacterium]